MAGMVHFVAARCYIYI